MTIDISEQQAAKLASVFPDAVDLRSAGSLAFDEFLLYREDFKRAVQEGIEAADRGELIEHADVVAMMDDIIAHG